MRNMFTVHGALQNLVQVLDIENGKIPLGSNHVVVCYLAPWALRTDWNRFKLDDIDPTLCTHIVYVYAIVNGDTNAIVSANPAYDLEKKNEKGAYKKLTSLKRDYPQLKILLYLRDSMVFGHPDEEYLQSNRMAFVTNVSYFLRKYKFDGLDLEWSYSSFLYSGPARKEKFVSFLKEFREEFDKFDLLLTAELEGKTDRMEKFYDIPAFSQYLHYMFALCYDYYSPYNSHLTGPNAPLYRRNEGDNLNVESRIDTLLRKGADPNKLVLGLPLFGNIFKLQNPKAGGGFGKESGGSGMPGPYMKKIGLSGYNEICLEVDNPNNNWTKYWDNVTHTPYASKGDQFISYDDANSLRDKVELAVRKNLAGVSVHNLEMDDFCGSCTFVSSSSSGYPLMRAINNALGNSVSWKKSPCPSRSSETGPVN